MTIIYLDEKLYIYLLRCYNGLKPHYPMYSEICRRIIESSDDGTNKFPLSLAHLAETSKKVDVAKIRDMFKFMFGISKFFSIRPWVQVINLEVRNAIRKSVGEVADDLSDFVFGDEFAHIFGRKAKFTYHNSEKPISGELKEKILSTYKSPEQMGDIISKVDEEYVRKISEEDIALAQKIAELRGIFYNIPDKYLKENINYFRLFSQVIGDDVIRECMNLIPENLRERWILKTFSSKVSLMEFLNDIPSVNVFFTLSYTRNRNIGGEIKPNDIWDFRALAIAIPYCDVVLHERKWANILNKSNIGKLYNTRILHKLEDLSQFLYIYFLLKKNQPHIRQIQVTND